MSSATVSKVVLKSNTTMTLSDRFSYIMKMKSPKKSAAQDIRTEQSQLAQASAKNKRLAEQMARRSGAEPIVQNATMSPPKPAGIKNRLGATKTIPTKARLGTIPRGGGVARGGGVSRGRGINLRRSLNVNKSTAGRGFSPRGRGAQRGGTRGGQRGAGVNRGRRNSWQGSGSNRGQGNRGRGRGGQNQGGIKSTREDLDKELDSYMGVKKNHITFDST